MFHHKSMTLGAKIKSLRMAKGLTQGELTRGEITPGLISQIESDRVAPSQRVIVLLAGQLGVDPAELLAEVDARNTQFQALKEARDLLSLRKASAALPILTRLSQAKVTYVPAMELKLELAFAKELLGQGEEALPIYEEVEYHAFISDDSALGANSLNRQGQYHLGQGRTAAALYCFKKAWDFAQTANNLPASTLSTSLRYISICLYRLGDVTQATHFAELALREAKTAQLLGDLGEICHILSVLCAEQGRAELALQYATDAVGIYRTLGIDMPLTDAKMNHAIVLRELGDANGALRALPGIIAEYYAQGRSAELANAWTERATCEILSDRYEDASRSLERGIAIAKADTVEYAEVQRVQGMLLAATGEPKKAILALENAATVLDRLNLINTDEEVLRRLRDLYTQTGDTENAFFCYERMCMITAQIKQKRLIASIIA